MLPAADDDWLHAYGEHTRADVGVVAPRDHELRLHRALGLLHGGRVVDLARSTSSVDGSERLGLALAGHLVPPHEVNLSAGQVGGSPVLTNGKRYPAPLRIGRRCHQHVAETLVAGVPGQLV